MRIIALDPGAKRCGWAILSEGEENRDEIKYHASGIFGMVRDSNYQEYRLLLIDYWVPLFYTLLTDYDFDVVVSEIVPPVGGNSASVVNRQLSLTVITAVQALARENAIPIKQIGASTVKKAIGGSGKASKVKVRDGVLARLPELEPRRPEWVGKGAEFDELDAIAIGLASFRVKG